MIAAGATGMQQTTSYKVVLPFYAYAAFSIVIGSLLLFFHTSIFEQHHFSPVTLSITHTMTLGWGSMMIFGASYQLLPVLISSKLHSNTLAYLTFGFTAIGIPLLIYGFYIFHTGWPLKSASVLINLGVLSYVVNLILSVRNSPKQEIHAWFIISASIWLFTTTFYGLLLVFNFTSPLLPKNSFSYLSIHAHLGFIGWFLILIIGVGSRLIPMFLISKYSNKTALKWILGLLNSSLISFLLIEFFSLPSTLFYLSIILGIVGVLIFLNHCRLAYKERIRRKIDSQMKISILSILQMVLPFVIMLIILIKLPTEEDTNLLLLYGFCILFGWITSIILGMTFKTLPFIIWNRAYQKKSRSGKTPAPKELFSSKIYDLMSLTYIIGFLLMVIGILLQNQLIIKIASLFLVLSAFFYFFNSAKIMLHNSLKK